jgi:hypothetical protein
MNRRGFLMLSAAALAPLPVFGATNAGNILFNWYRLILELVRHTATYSPPVASRAFAYLGITAYEALVSGNPDRISLAGQVNELTPVPARDGVMNDAAVMQGALVDAVRNFFGNTGPTGQRAMDAMQRQLDKTLASIDPDTLARSLAYGKAVADHILAWSQTDGGAFIENMGFPDGYKLTDGPAHWVPTSKIALQQAPLLPNWGNNRTFAMASGQTCMLDAPPEYSGDPASQFYQEAMEVVAVTKVLTPEQKTIAKFWSDDPMLSPTPPGHWISIAMQIIERDAMDGMRSADLLARLGITLADAFIGCWAAKMKYDLLRPVTYINRVIDKKWAPMLITPPFPEYPSGHSTQSGAAAAVLTAFFGEGFAFSDATHVDDGIPARDFPDFWAAAQEAGISRMYGGIHFRAAIDRGLEQGRCIGTTAAELRTVK